MRKTALILSAAITAGILAGCAGGRQTANTGGEKLSIWMQLMPVVSYSYKNFGETPIAKKLAENVGMELEFVHPSQGQEKEQFNLMIASKELPDIIYCPATYFKGGITQAVSDGIVVGLNDYINDKDAPNIKKLIDADESIGKAMKLDDGTYCGFPSVAGDRYLQTFKGLIIRQDWLDKLGLDMPETVDEWENVLTAFKDKLGASAPYTLLGTNEFAGAYGCPRSYYYDVDKKQISYGALEPGYKDFLTTMNRWYESGLLDREFATQNQTIADSKITNGQSGVISTGAASGINKYAAAMSDVEGVRWAGAPYPVLNKGDRPMYGQLAEKASVGYFVTSACKNIAAAVKFLDYGFSDEGHMLYNFGIEGESYTMVDGYPKYTEDMTDNADGIAMSNQLAKYVMSVYGGPFVQDRRYFEQYLKRDEQKEAIERWSEVENSADLPSLILTAEEGESIATELADISSYWIETEYKLIMGKQDMSEFDACVQKLRDMGIDKVLGVYNDAYKRKMEK